MEYKFRIWLTKGETKVFGEGPLRLLKKVEELGSLRQAAIFMEMSYSKAWKIVKTMEEALEIPILERQVGGQKGGGSTLTQEARDFIQRYEVLREHTEVIIKEKIDSLF